MKATVTLFFFYLLPTDECKSIFGSWVDGHLKGGNKDDQKLSDFVRPSVLRLPFDTQEAITTQV